MTWHDKMAKALKRNEIQISTPGTFWTLSTTTLPSSRLRWRRICDRILLTYDGKQNTRYKWDCPSTWECLSSVPIIYPSKVQRNFNRSFCLARVRTLIPRWTVQSI